MKKALIPILIVILLCAACGAEQDYPAFQSYTGSQAQTNNAFLDYLDAQQQTPEAKALMAYEDFLLNQRSAIIDEANNTERVYRYCEEYALFDMNNDTIPELHLKSKNGYNIFTYKNDEVVFWQGFTNGAILLNNYAVVEINKQYSQNMQTTRYCIVGDKDIESTPLILIEQGESNHKLYAINGNIVDKQNYDLAVGQLDVFVKENKFVFWNDYTYFVKEHKDEYIPINLTEEYNFEYPDDKGMSLFPSNQFTEQEIADTPWESAMPYVKCLLRNAEEINNLADENYTNWSLVSTNARNGSAYSFLSKESGICYYFPKSAFQQNPSGVLAGDERLLGISLPFTKIFDTQDTLEEILKVFGAENNMIIQEDRGGYQVFLENHDLIVEISKEEDGLIVNSTVTLWYWNLPEWIK